MKPITFLIAGITLLLCGWSFAQDNSSTREGEFKQRAEANTEWLIRNNINVNRLPEADTSLVRYLCDSTLVLKETKGDTINIWYNRVKVFFDTVDIIKFINHPLYGKRLFIEGVNKQGNITLVRLELETFLVRNDSLFLLDDFYTISSDSMRTVYTVPKEEFAKAYHEIIEKNRYYELKLIFHPDLFIDGVYTKNRKRDRIKLASVWEVDNVKYYELHFMRKYEPYGLRRKLLFDENFVFLEYEDCFEDVLNRLTEETLIYENR